MGEIEKPEVELKIVIIGDGAVGKSAMLYSYVKKQFREDYIPTVMSMFTLKMALPEVNVKAEIYDTAGQEEFAAIRKINLQGADVVLICYGCDSITSLENIETSWVSEVKELEKEPIYLFIGTKKDKFVAYSPHCVTYNVAAAMGRRLKAAEVLECSAKDYGESGQSTGNVDKVFKAAVKYGLIRMGVLKETPPPGLCCFN